MIWITGYVGSGKSTISETLKDVHEFDEIERLMLQSGIDMSKINSHNFKDECKNFLKSTDIKAFNGVQAVDYYKKGDKVYFLNTSFIESNKRCKKRDNKEKLSQDIKDNLVLFFKLKLLKLRCIINKDLIKDINILKNN